MLTIRPVIDTDRAGIAKASAPIGGPVIVSNGLLYDLTTCAGLICERPRGWVLWHDHGKTREILALIAAPQGKGTGRALLEAAAADARAKGLSDMQLDTTNDNIRAIRFYHRNGFKLTDTVLHGFAEVLRLKGLPPDPVTGHDGEHIRDILRFAKAL